MGKVNPELYKLLLENECHLYRNNNEVRAWVSLYFWQIEDFIKIIGEDYFCESGIQITLCKDYVAIDLNEILEHIGDDLKDYKNCFEENEWEEVQPSTHSNT